MMTRQCSAPRTVHHAQFELQLGSAQSWVVADCFAAQVHLVKFTA
jgi:hypothetical protein